MSITYSEARPWLFALTMAVLLFAVVLALTTWAQAAETYDVESNPEEFFLFNTTSRTYSDVLQWSGGSNSISMRCVNGTLTYKPFGNWMGLYLNDTLKVASYWYLHDGKGFFFLTKGSWQFIDLGETLVVMRYCVKDKVNVTEHWEFDFKLGKHPKLTFIVNNTGKKKLALDWSLEVPKATIPKSTSYNTTAVKSMTVAGFIEVDWSDYKEKVLVTEDSSTDKLTIRFKPDYVTGNFTIDPSVGFTVFAPIQDRCWLVLGVRNTNNPDTTEVLDWNLFNWEFIDHDTPSTYPIGCNPYPVDNTIAAAEVKVYDMWGRTWNSGAYFPTGGAGSYVYIEVELPVCWISVRTSDMIRDHDAFHRWTIAPVPPSTPTVEIDENIKFPVIVDASNQVNWEVSVPEDVWIEDAGMQLIVHASLVNRREYVVYFNVTMKDQPTNVWLRMYDNATGQGIPWETFLVYVDDVLTPTDIIPAWTNCSYTVNVTDFFGNVLYSNTSSPTDAPLHLWSIPLDIYSCKLFNQDPDYIHKIGLLWGGAGTPYEFYIAPAEVVELFLYAGTYEVRWTPYHRHVAQTTQTFSLVITEANYFLINGTTISQVVSDVAGVYSLQQVITNFVTPDVLWSIECPALCPSERDPDMETYWVHPYAITKATISQSIVNATSGFLWTPHPDRPGRNYNILSDVLYTAGPYDTQIIINWSGNGTEAFNTTYNPGVINLADGGSYTVWTNRSCTFTRRTTWQEHDLFFWLYTPARRQYEVTLWVNNTMNVTWFDISWFVGFPESSDIDLDGIRIDDNNNAIRLVRGESFDVSPAGIFLSFTRINVSQIRSFTFTVWDSNASVTAMPPLLTLVGEERETHDGVNQYHLTGSWTNSYALPYSGVVYLNLKIKGAIDPNSVKIVVDNRQLAEDQFTVAGSTVIIASDGVGTVAVGNAIDVDVYYDKSSADGAFSIFSPLVGPVSLYWLGFVLVMGVGYFGSFRVKGHERRQYYWISILTMVCAFILLGMLHIQGVIE